MPIGRTHEHLQCQIKFTEQQCQTNLLQPQVIKQSHMPRETGKNKHEHQFEKVVTSKCQCQGILVNSHKPR